MRRLRRHVLSHWLDGAESEDALSCDRPDAPLRSIVQADLDAGPVARQGFLVFNDPVPLRRFGRPAPGSPRNLV